MAAPGQQWACWPAIGFEEAKGTVVDVACGGDFECYERAGVTNPVLDPRA